MKYRYNAISEAENAKKSLRNAKEGERRRERAKISFFSANAGDYFNGSRSFIASYLATIMKIIALFPGTTRQ
jgi:hypothetical protein